MEDSPNHLPLFRIQLLSSAAPTRSFLRLYSTLLRLCRPLCGESLTHRPRNAPLISSPRLRRPLCGESLTHRPRNAPLISSPRLRRPLYYLLLQSISFISTIKRSSSTGQPLHCLALDHR